MQQSNQGAGVVTSEIQRQFYLSMVGVQTWYARSPLPGAAPSPQFHFPEEEVKGPETPRPGTATPAHEPVPPSESTAGSGQKLARLRALMAEEPAEGTPLAPGAAEQTIAAAPETLQLSWGFWVSERYVLVSGLSENASEQLQDTLARNILAAMGEPDAGFQSLRWPVFRNLKVPGNSPEDLARLLTGLSREFSGKTLLCLGVLGGDAQPEYVSWLGEALGQPGIKFPASLGELSTAPELKRELWGQLRPLLDRQP